MPTPSDSTPYLLALALALAACQDSKDSDLPGADDGNPTGGDTDAGSDGASGDDPAPQLGCEGEDVQFVPIHRMTRSQYANTVRDLLGLEIDVTSALPTDTIVGGFDNNAGSLGMNASVVDAYHRLVAQLASQVTSDEAALGQLVSCDAQDPACRPTIVRDFLGRAWRRPVEDAELEPYLALFDVAEADGGDFIDGLELVVNAGLMSPGFLFRLELDPNPDDPEIRALTGYEIASRLSYFLWNTMPDEALFQAAADGELLTSDGLQAQVERMLSSPRALALVDDFAAQWLGFATVEAFNRPDPEHFPEVNDALIGSMQEQTRRTMTEFVLGGQSFSELLTHDRLYINPALAELYGITHPTGDGFAVVETDDPERQGLLSHASVLTLTSAPERTSPVKRGLWVMTNLLCSEPPPPPPGVEAELEQSEEEGSIREVLEQHRTDPTCAACHVVMDEIGFGFERYDAIGRQRQSDAFGPIDASGIIPDPNDASQSVEFDGVSELSQILQDDPRLPACIAEKLYTYAASRVPTRDGDYCRIDQVSVDFTDEQQGFDAAVRSTVIGDAFRFRRGSSE